MKGIIPMLYEVSVHLPENTETFKVKVDREEDVKTFVKLYYPEAKEFDVKTIKQEEEEKK